MTTASDRADPFRHLAVFFHDVDDVVATLSPMLIEALARGDLVWAAVDGPVGDAFRRHLGSAADDVVFGEPAQPYSYSGQTTASRRGERLRELTADGRAALILSDSGTVGGPGPRSSAPDFWSVVDASCNLALSGLPVTLVCLCDANGASEEAEQYLYWNHPELFDGARASPNPRYRTPDQVLASVPAPPAPPLGPPTHLATFEGVTALRGVRTATRRHGKEAGLSDEQVDGLVLAIGELVSNSIEHGPGHGTLSWWTWPGRLVAQIHDVGHMTTTPPGLRRPDVRSVRGRGVWLARQLSDVLHFWTGADGTHVRLEISG